MKVDFIDFSEQYRMIKDEVDQGLKAVFEKGDFILGQQAKTFESEFAKFSEAKYGAGVNSGTDALFLALCSLNIGPGDEVIVPSFTFIATALCVSYTGAKPVFVDIEDETYNLNPKVLEKAINKHTKAVIPVHLYGQPANIKEISAITQKHNVKIVEDGCQAHGARYQGKRVGSLGDVACFSFYPTKSLGACGDGGIVLTNDEAVYKQVCMLRDYGRTSRYEHKFVGYNSRLDTIQAVVLNAKLKHLDEWNQMRNQCAQVYFKLLKDTNGVVIPKIKDDRTHVFQTFAVRVKNRDRVCEEMQKKGVSVLIHYPIPLHLQEAYAQLGYKRGDLPVSEKIAGEILSLPMFPHMTQEQIEYVCESLKAALKA